MCFLQVGRHGRSAVGSVLLYGCVTCFCVSFTSFSMPPMLLPPSILITDTCKKGAELFQNTFLPVINSCMICTCFNQTKSFFFPAFYFDTDRLQIPLNVECRQTQCTYLTARHTADGQRLTYLLVMMGKKVSRHNSLQITSVFNSLKFQI